MRILCCLDGTNSEQISRAVSTLLIGEEHTISLLYVTDIRPHEEMERRRGSLLRPHPSGPSRKEQMHQAEQAAAQDILEETQRRISGAELVQREGRPEREIVNYAAEWNADLIVICSHSSLSARSPIGPKSVGPVARFVLDHAPVPVLLVRPLHREQFPLQR